MFEKDAKKKPKPGRKYTDEDIDKANDLAERMMGSKNFEGDWSKAFALSRWMLGKKKKDGKPYEVKKKPGKPHQKYKKKKKNKKAEMLNDLVMLADFFDAFGLIKEADAVTATMTKFAQEEKQYTFSKEQVREIGNSVGINWEDYDIHEFVMGMEVELEHGTMFPESNVTDDDPTMTFKIAWAHLMELPNYYTLLDHMENKGKNMMDNVEEIEEEVGE